MKTILVIEDHQAIREEIITILKLEDFCVLEANNGLEGVQMAREHHPDLILCDIAMPELNGYDTLSILRGDPSTATIPFIFLTARTTKEDIRTGMRIGADDYLTKPFTIDELLTTVKTRLERKSEIISPYLKQLYLLESAIYQVNDAIMIVTTAPTFEECQIAYINPAFCNILGYQETELTGHSLAMLQTQLAISPPNEMGQFELCPPLYRKTVSSRDGARVYHVECNTTPLTDDDDQITHLVLIYRDITQRQELEEQFRQTQKMEAVGRLAGGVAHDFNNLLTIISGYSSILLTKLTSESPLYKYIQEIHKAGQRAAALTRQLLVFSRKQELKPEVIDLNAVITNLNEMLKRLVREDITLELALASDLPSLEADVGQLEQILVNLVVNARDAMPQGGKIAIQTTQLENQVLLTVKDTGCGMDEKTQQQIFEPYFTTKDPDKGTGLGLSTVYSIVKQSGGNIEVKSELELGSAFNIYLPLAIQKKQEEKTPKESHQPILEGKETILMVEDEADIRGLYSEILRDLGYTVLEASNGQEGLTVFEQHSETINLVITDGVMPQMNGPEMVKHLKQANPNLKVLLITGYLEDAQDPQLGINAFLRKPFVPKELISVIREILDQENG